MSLLWDALAIKMEEDKAQIGRGDDPDENIRNCFLCQQKNCHDFCQICFNERGIKQYYCSLEHRSYHEQAYATERGPLKPFCCPYEIKRSEKIGRYLMATRIIQPGELIFTENPLMIGPHHETKPVCLACGSNNVNEDYVCPSCSLPLCNEDCFNMKNSPHRNFECEIFSKERRSIVSNFHEPHPFYQCILPLRCLLLQMREKWVENIINVMMDHVDDKPKDIHWQAYQKNIVEYLRESQGLGALFSPDEINHVIGILDVNAFDLSTNGRGLYPLTALMSHSCVSNTKYIIRKHDNVIECRATVQISPGEELTDHYISPLLGTDARRASLKDGWYFDCECSRCLDPTELNTHMSSFLCDNCKDGFLCKSKEDWICTSCLIVSNIPYSKITEEVSEKVDKSTRSISELESLLQKCVSARFSPTHYLVLTLKRYLIYAYKGQNLLNDELIERIKGYCHNLLSVADVVTPGLTKERGLTLYELTRLQLYELERQSSPDLRGLEMVVANLKIVVSCLEYEDESTFQADIRREAKRKLNQMTEILTLLKLMTSTKTQSLQSR